MDTAVMPDQEILGDDARPNMIFVTTRYAPGELSALLVDRVLDGKDSFENIRRSSSP